MKQFVPTFALAVLIGLALSHSPGHGTPPTVPYAGPVVTAQVPYQAAVYGGNPGLSPDQAKELLSLLRSIDAKLSDIEDKIAPGAAKVVLKTDPLKVAAAKCAACHVPGKADTKGGGYLLFADDSAKAFRLLGGRDKKRISEAVETGTMPPSGPLSAAEKAHFKW